MKLIERLYAFPHEGLHVLALWLIGRKPERIGRMHVDIPHGLPKWQYIFVAGLPSGVFLIIWAVGIIGLLRAGDFLQIALALLASLFGAFGVAGGMGDLQLIWLRFISIDKDERQ